MALIWSMICILIYFMNTNDMDRYSDSTLLSQLHNMPFYSLLIGECLRAYYEQKGLDYEFQTQPTANGVQYVQSFDTVQHFDVLVVGAGLSGAVIAERYANLGYAVLIVEKRGHVGGNCYDYLDESTGIRVNKYGAHLFHTNEAKIWRYVNAFDQWERFDHRVLAYVDGKYVPVPVNMNTVNLLFNDTNFQNSEEMKRWLEIEIGHRKEPARNSEEMAINRVGWRLYEKIFKPYTQKQWDVQPSALDASVTGRIPVHLNFDNRYFSDRYQGLPQSGYTKWVESLLSHKLIQVYLNKDFFDVPMWVRNYAKKIFYTGPIDKYFGESGLLDYRSLRFEHIKVLHHQGFVQPAPVINYPSLEFPYTRIVEYKQLPFQRSNHSILVREYSSKEGEPYYPVPNAQNRQKYQSLCTKLVNTSTKTVFVGRLANYKYFNMDDSIKNSLEVFWNETRRLHVIITKFREDISWIQNFCFMLKNIRVAWFVYLKNPDEDPQQVRASIEKLVWVQGCSTDSVTVIDHRSNVGREGLAWAEYMLTYGTDAAWPESNRSNATEI